MFTGFSVPNVSVTIDGETYYPPIEGSGPVPIVLSDSSSINISNDVIENGDTTVTIPRYSDLVSGSSNSIGSWGITFAQRQFGASSCSGASDIVSCFVSAMEEFLSAASAIQQSLASVSAQMLQSTFFDAWSAAGLASDASSYAIALDTLATDIESAASSLQSAVNSMDSAMNTVNSELGALTDIELDDFSAINQRYFEAYDYGSLQDITSVLHNLANIVQKIVKVGSTTPAMEPLLTAVKANWKLLTLGNGIAAVGLWSAQQFGTATVSELNDLVAANGTTNDTESANLTERSHFLHFSTGFSIPLFDIITSTIDHDAGVKTANDSSVNDAVIKNGDQAVFGPGYTTDIPLSLGVLLSQLPFIQTVYVHPTWDEDQEIEKFLGTLRNMTDENVYDSTGTGSQERDAPLPGLS